MKTVRAPSERSELQQHCKWVHGRCKARDRWEGGLLVKYYIYYRQMADKGDRERVRVISSFFLTTFLTSKETFIRGTFPEQQSQRIDIS